MSGESTYSGLIRINYMKYHQWCQLNSDISTLLRAFRYIGEPCGSTNIVAGTFGADDSCRYHGISAPAVTPAMKLPARLR